MSEYVIQIQEKEAPPPEVGVGWLAKSFQVNETCPIPETWPTDRTQIILTNSSSYDAIVRAYNEYGWPAVLFSYDSEAETISCTGKETNTWPIN